MEEELENGIALLEGILENWEAYNPGGKYQIFFPKCTKENDTDIVLFPIFEENSNGTLFLKVWGKYNLESYILEEYVEAKNKIILFDKKLINYKKKKFSKNVIALIEIFYIAQEFMNLPEDSIEYIANQELLEEKVDDYKKNFKSLLEDEELAVLYGVKKNEPVKTEVAKIPSSGQTNSEIRRGNSIEEPQINQQNNLVKIEGEIKNTPSKRGRKKKVRDTVMEQVAETVGLTQMGNIEEAGSIGQITQVRQIGKTRQQIKTDYSGSFDDIYQNVQIVPMGQTGQVGNSEQYENISQTTQTGHTEQDSAKKSKRGRKPKKVDLTIKKLQECISKIDHKNKSKEKYMLKLMEEVGELAEDVNNDARMQGKEIKGTIEEELQDVLYYVVCLANIYGIDLEECIYLKEELNCKKYNRENMFKD